MNVRASVISMTSAAHLTPMIFGEKFCGFTLSPMVVTQFQREIYSQKVLLRRGRKYIPWVTEMSGVSLLTVKLAGSIGVRLVRIRIRIQKPDPVAMMNKIKQKVQDFL